MTQIINTLIPLSFLKAAVMLSFLGCSTRYLIAISFPIAFSSSLSSLFNEVFDAFNWSIIFNDEVFIPSSNDDNLFVSKNDEEVVVLLDKSSSILFAKGTEADDVVGFLSSTSSSWTLMVLMDWTAETGDGDFLERFSNVETKKKTHFKT